MPTLGNIFPSFIVADVTAAVAFYTDKLGFDVRHIAPAEGPFFAIVGRDDVSIMLKAINPDVKPVPNHTLHAWAPWDAYIYVPDPDVLYEEYSAKGVAFRRPLRDDEDRLRGFEVMDADGYVLFFGRPIPIPVFKQMSPQLMVTQIEPSIEFYTKNLGFSLAFRYEDFYAGILKDGHSIHLKCGDPPGTHGQTEVDLALTFSVDNIDRLYKELQQKSINIVQALRDMPYGREFYIADPDGNRIAFLEI